MNNVENRVHAAMSAAADSAAREICTAPPLHLPTELVPVAPHARPQRRWIRWTAPFAAAAAIVAVAGSLVLVKGTDNASNTPAKPTTAPSPSVPTGPGGVPRYYAALAFPTKNGSVQYGVGNAQIVVGDTVTGQTLANFAPPKDTEFLSATAASNDHTFVVSAMTSSNGKFGIGAGTITNEWFEVRLAFGTADPVLLAALPIAPQASTGNGIAALSSSGQDLAVAQTTAWNKMTVQVFSVATGRLLHDWTYTDPSWPNKPKNKANAAELMVTDMGWLNGDQQLALAIAYQLKSGGAVEPLLKVNVAGSASGDLMKDSTVAETMPTPVMAQCFPNLQISADGKTFSCPVLGTTASDSPVPYGSVGFRTYPITTNAADAKLGKSDFEVRSMGTNTIQTPVVLWASPTGDTIIGAWAIYSPTRVKGMNVETEDGHDVGVISNGKYTPLRLPNGVSRGFVYYPTQIAF